jgi:hypothetical protein
MRSPQIVDSTCGQETNSGLNICFECPPRSAMYFNRGISFSSVILLELPIGNVGSGIFSNFENRPNVATWPRSGIIACNTLLNTIPYWYATWSTGAKVRTMVRRSSKLATSCLKSRTSGTHNPNKQPTEPGARRTSKIPQSVRLCLSKIHFRHKYNWVSVIFFLKVARFLF